MVRTGLGQRSASALLEVEEACGLARMPARPSARQRHISGLLHIFLAHTWRYQAPTSGDPEEAYNRADAMYTAADRLFEGDQRRGTVGPARGSRSSGLT